MHSSRNKGTTIIDFDGSRIRVPGKYKDIIAQNKLFEDARKGACPCPAVMVTIRCQVCGVIEIHLLDHFPAQGATIKLGVPELHTHPL